jgi:hypothetical protein
MNLSQPSSQISKYVLLQQVSFFIDKKTHLFRHNIQRSHKHSSATHHANSLNFHNQNCVFIHVCLHDTTTPQPATAVECQQTETAMPQTPLRNPCSCKQHSVMTWRLRQRSVVARFGFARLVATSR